MVGKAKLRDPFLLSVLWCCQPWVNKASRSGDLCETFKGKTRACKDLSQGLWRHSLLNK